MVQTITPVVHGGRRGRWAVSVALHALGGVVAAAAFGATLGAGGRLLGAPWGWAGVAAAVAVAGLYAARELLDLSIPLPDRHRQVPEWWRAYFPPPLSAFLYGAALGVGFLTFLRHGTLVAVAVVAVASGDPALGAIAVGAFGIARGLSVAVVASGRTDERVGRVIDRLDRLAMSGWPRLVNGVALLAVGTAVVVAGLPADASGPHPALPLVLAAVFGWAAVAKAARPAAWREALRGYRLPRAIGRPALLGVPASEAAVAALVLAGPPRAAGG
ncbi:MAG TPA: MauE/DoxX family redox-associated membrane protein, partial [Actinomycetota bacterium]|nr:MauE/DoxX family redox-associated membrane protein [Actinomycetota bacterium]